MVQSKSPAYQWYPKDILASARVAEMTAEVECWYRRALDFAWVNDSLPADPKRCAAIIGKGCTVEGAEQVLEMFVFDRKDSTRKIHERQEVERKKQAANRREKSKAGKASAEKRKQDKALREQQASNSRSTGVATSVGTEGATKFNSSSSSSSSVGFKDPQPPKAVYVGGQKLSTEKPPTLPTSVEKEINSWLAALAPVLGAKSADTIADLKRWRETVAKAVREQHDLIQFLDTAKAKLEVDGRFFTPEGVLKAVQTANRAKGNTWTNG